MAPIGRTSRKLSSLFRGYLIDCSIFVLGFLLAIKLRLGSFDEFSRMLPSILIGALVFGASSYVIGLYSTRPKPESRGRTMAKLTLALATGIAAILLAVYVNYSGHIGRGIMMIAVPAICIGIYCHRLISERTSSFGRERIVFVLWHENDEDLMEFFCSLSSERLRLLGVVNPDGKEVGYGEIPCLGKLDQLKEICETHEVMRIICSDDYLESDEHHNQWRPLRYRGVEVSTMTTFCEEFFQFTPVDLITPRWLVNACSAPQAFYIRKAKRLADILVSSVLGVVLLPLFLLGALLVKLSSSGPVFFVQERVGRFGHLFKVVKLRSMRTDAEVDGAVWASGGDDPRQTQIGRWLRKFRIDEIPQLWNVWKGEMSLVGPRPERPEFTGKLSEEMAFYDERHLVTPGLTGWAQVSYPYGASVEDSRHKLEHDLYYIKHMSLFFDLAILLETARICIIGGLSEETASRDRPWLAASLTYSKTSRVATPVESEPIGASR